MNRETGAQRRDLRRELRRRRDGRRNIRGHNGRRERGCRGRHHGRGEGVVIGGSAASAEKKPWKMGASALRTAAEAR
uniref:Uncharacterized protein n=1 Tax=Oryza barthii TaxID=65489 RepID=A0A0D3HNF5_9ORYZ